MRIGQGLLLEMDYADGGKHNKPRTYLIIEINDENIKMLNISSIKGKEHKLGYNSNKRIYKYNPPFLKPSFVKLDAEYIISYDDILENCLLDNGRAMNPIELKQIKKAFENFKKIKNIIIQTCGINDIFNLSSSKQVAASDVNKEKQ